jgi:hypothetical protein
LALAQRSKFALLRILILTDLKLGYGNRPVLTIALHGCFMSKPTAQNVERGPDDITMFALS